MATKTYSAFLRQPRSLHAGVNAEVVEVSATAGHTVSAGDVLKLFKLPDRAVILGGYITRSEPGGDLTLRLNIPMTGASGTASTTVTTLLESTASGQVHIGDVNDLGTVGYQISISDAVIVKEATVEILGASASTTGPIKVMLLWSLDART
ncbi:MAG: hypothetical protein HKM94_03965 [Halobacteria archaeon]|nr:hypothetical protein [Halobacteria archaeon]